jgi:YD repeat-containing protein
MSNAPLNCVFTNNATSPTLLSVLETSCDGLQTWQTSYNGGQAITSTSQTGYNRPTNYRYSTNTAPDGTKTISAYQYGWLKSVTQRDAANSQLGQTPYAYDVYGRAASVTDARNGTATYAYNNADLAVTVTTPAPGTGQAAQTTSTVYDRESRVVDMISPDNTSITNVYYPGGELNLVSGSRTYPVDYGYGSQGRMIKMTNWTTDPSVGQRVTTWNYYTHSGFLSNKVDQAGAWVTYTYTPSGRLKSRTWARGIRCDYAYVANSFLIGQITYKQNTTAKMKTTKQFF